jgi:Cys-tRNA(Pro)/Cys-tRNA(Cys) deacylase
MATGTPATLALSTAGIAFTLHPYRHDPAAESFGLEAAAELGVDPDQVFKTLMTTVDQELCAALVPVSCRLDLKALARALGASKAAMAHVAIAERATGYVAGGISPIGQKRRHRTVIDETALLHDTIYVSGGRRGLDVGVAPLDLVGLTAATVADIAR